MSVGLLIFGEAELYVNLLISVKRRHAQPFTYLSLGNSLLLALTYALIQVEPITCKMIRQIYINTISAVEMYLIADDGGRKVSLKRASISKPKGFVIMVLFMFYVSYTFFIL